MLEAMRQAAYEAGRLQGLFDAAELVQNARMKASEALALGIIGLAKVEKK